MSMILIDFYTYFMPSIAERFVATRGCLTHLNTFLCDLSAVRGQKRDGGDWGLMQGSKPQCIPKMMYGGCLFLICIMV